MEAVGKMVAELKLMQGKLDTVQNWQTENEQKYAEMHADYMEYKIKNEEIEGQQEGQLEAETSVPTFIFGQTIPQTEQTVPITMKAEPSAGQAQGAFAGQPESSSPFVTPNSHLGNSPSSQQSGFGSDFTFLHTPLQQTRDNNPNNPPPPFPPPGGAGSSSAAPQNIFTTTTWKPKDPPCFHGKSTEDAHAWVAMVRNYFIFMAGTMQQEVAYAATLLRDVAQEWWVGYLRKNHGKYPRDWDAMAQAILERFGSNLRAEMAQAQLQYITQGSRSVREYSAEFELHMGRLESFDERSLIRQFIWGLEESLAKAVTLQYPKTIHAAIGHAEAIELAGLASRRPRGASVPRGGAQSGRGGVMQEELEVCSEADFGDVDREVDIWEVRPRGVEVVLELVVLACSEDVDFHRGDHKQVQQQEDVEVALQVHLLAGHVDQRRISQPIVQEICKLVEVDVDRGIVDSEEVVHQVVVGLEFVLQVFLLFGMNLARRFTSLTRANCCLTSQKINRMNKLSRKLRKTYEALSVVQLGQRNAKKHVIRSLETLGN